MSVRGSGVTVKLKEMFYWGKWLKEDIYKNVPPPSAFKVLECPLAFSPESNQRGKQGVLGLRGGGGGGTGKYSRYSEGNGLK